MTQNDCDIPPGGEPETPDQRKIEDTAAHYLEPEEIGPRERNVIRRLLSRRTVATDMNRRFDSRRDVGDRLADGVATFGGSWTFILCFIGFLTLWTLGNILARGEAPDPYPFIFLNLILSMLAAFQAPIIMMSQNRQAEKDRLNASHDYEVNLKSEIEIMALHEKLDRMRNEELRAIVAKQEEQITLLGDLLRQAIHNLPQDAPPKS